jgi:hypothetical protein
MNLGFWSIFVHTSTGSLRCVTSYNMEPNALLPLQIFTVRKISFPSAGF